MDMKGDQKAGSQMGWRNMILRSIRVSENDWYYKQICEERDGVHIIKYDLQ